MKDHTLLKTYGTLKGELAYEATRADEVNFIHLPLDFIMALEYVLLS